MPDAYLVVENGRFIDCNESALQLLKTSIDKLRTLSPASVFEIFNHIDLQSALKPALSQYDTQFISTQMYLSNGTSTNVKIRLILISEDEKCILIQVDANQTNNLSHPDNEEINAANFFNNPKVEKGMEAKTSKKTIRIPVNSLFDLKLILKFYTPESCDPIINAYNHCLESGTPFDIEFQTITPEGKRAWLHAYGSANRNEQGKIISVEAYIQDIDKHEQIETVIQNAQQLIHRIF